MYSFVCFSVFSSFLFVFSSWKIHLHYFTKVSRFTNYEYSLSPSLTRQTQTPNMDLMLPTAQNPRDGIPSRSAPLFFTFIWQSPMASNRKLRAHSTKSAIRRLVEAMNIQPADRGSLEMKQVYTFCNDMNKNWKCSDKYYTPVHLVESVENCGQVITFTDSIRWTRVYEQDQPVG